jgi:cysteine-rich repeat protein
MRCALWLIPPLFGACALFAVPAAVECEAAGFPRCDEEDPGVLLICADGLLLREDCGAGAACDPAAAECAATCGDATIGPGEQCDDGNLLAGDGCDEGCAFECEAAALGAAAAAPLAASCIAFFSAPRSWDDAQRDCEAKGGALSVGGHLMTIPADADNREADAVMDADAWIGANDLAAEGAFAWITGEPFGFTAFAASEPDGGTAQNCLVAQKQSPAAPAWASAGCGSLNPYLCEFEISAE